MRTSPRALPAALLCCLAILHPAVPLHAAPQAPPDPSSVDRIRARLEAPARPLTPSAPAQLTPTFRSSVDKHPFVLTLEQELHKQFDMNALQRQSADWSSRCCGMALGPVWKSIERARDERTASKTRQQIARELAALKEAKAASERK